MTTNLESTVLKELIENFEPSTILTIEAGDTIHLLHRLGFLLLKKELEPEFV